VGTDDVSVEGYLAGIIPVDYHIPTKYLEVEPTISAGITAHFLCYSQTVFSKDLVKAHWDNGRTPVTFNALLSQPMLLELKTEESELKPMSRNYLKRESRWLAGGKPKERALMSIMTAVSADTSNPQVKIMKDNIYPYADAKLLCNGDELWLVWVEDNSERSDLNRTQLMYSAYKDGSWSAPQWIADDGTADFSPTAAAAENGVLMAWQNNKQALAEGASLGDTIENAEISVTQNVYTDVDSDPRVVTLTDDSKFDHAPKLAADGNNALLVWTKSEGLGFTLGEDTEQYRAPANSDRLVFSSWNGSIWSEPMEIANSLPTVIHSSLTMNGSEGLLLYTLDMDNDQSTQQDREVFARIYDGSAWEEEIRLTDNQVSDDSPKAVYSNGEWFMTWYQDGNIMYQVGLDGAAGTEEFLEKLPSNYEIAVKEGTKPQVALVYRQMGEDNARRLATSFYDMEKEVWSDEIVLTEEAGYIRSFSPVFTEDDRLTAAYTQAEIINEVIDGEEHPKTSSKVDLYTMTYTPQSDLTLDEEFGLQLSPEIPWPDSAAVSTVVIKNEGDYAENVTLHLYDGNPDAGGTKIGEATTKEPIPARSSAQVEISWVIDAEERDKYNFYAVVDPEDTIWENDESNNVINHEVVTADIAVTDLQCRNLAKDNYMVTAMVKNTGSRSLQEVKIELNNSQSTQPIDSKELDQLRPGQEVGLSFLVSSSGLRADANGKIQMMLTASLPEGVEEFSAENNTYEFELVSAQIVVTRMNPTPGESQVGIQQPLTLDFNMNVEQGTDFEQIRLEDDYLNAVDISKMLDGSTLTVTPQTALDHNTRYTLTIPGDAVGDDYGHKMEEAYQLSFVTTSSSPEIALAYPGSGLEDVSPDTDIKMQFNQHILEGPAIEGIKLSGPGSEEISTSVSIEGEWLYVYPMSSLEINSAYSLLVPAAAVKNDRGELLQEDYSAAFETGNERKEETDDGDDNQQFDYRITRETAADGSTRAVVSVSQDDLLNIQTVTIDVSEQVSEDEAVSVNFSPDAAKKLTNSRSNLMITTGKGDLLFPAGILASLAGDGGSSISITIAENNQQDTGSDSVSNGAFDFSISKGEEQVKEFTGEVLVIIPLDMSRVGNAKRVIVCVYDKATNSWKPVGGVADAADGSITFKTRHFSTYAAFETVKHFDDVTSDWAKEEVEVLASRRLINGKTENTFDPEGSITRAEFTALIVRSLYTDLLDRKGTFKDVPNDTWFSGAVETACAKGLINGTGDDKFQPNAEISREQLATIAYRFYQYKTGDESGMDNKNKLFKDNRDISSWAEEAVNFVSSNQIMIGSEDRFYPQRSTNRQEAAVVLYRLLEYIGEL
jgi:hypothetical protein